MTAALLASIPSPSTGSLEIGPLRLNAYGLMIAIGVIVAVRIASRRMEQRGVGTSDDMSSIAMWAVPAGVIGGRLYHVATSVDSYRGRWIEVLWVWKGGLGIWGGVALGVIVGMRRARALGLDPVAVVACAAPGIAVAQAIGRWGNWFNQELFGRPTDVPWALEVSAAKARAAGYAAGTTFHPTFLYESLGCLAIAGLLVLVERRFRTRGGQIFLVYVAMYTVMRFFVEGLRVDPARSAGGLRLNQWVAIVVFTVAVTALLLLRRGSGPGAGGSTVSDHE
ncbi:MAG: prolipoprotein diacylglyceryl transferase [Ilumatobacteraceae bacterium]